MFNIPPLILDIARLVAVELPDHDLYIECKAFYSERIIKQIKDKRNVIVIQGYESANFLKDLLIKYKKYYEQIRN